MSGLLLSPKISQCGLEDAHGNMMSGSGPQDHPQDKERRRAIKVAETSLLLQAVQ